MQLSFWGTKLPTKKCYSLYSIKQNETKETSTAGVKSKFRLWRLRIQEDIDTIKWKNQHNTYNSSLSDM